MYTLGIDIGASSVKTALLDEHDGIVFKQRIVHQGKQREATLQALEAVAAFLRDHRDHRDVPFDHRDVPFDHRDVPFDHRDVPFGHPDASQAFTRSQAQKERPSGHPDALQAFSRSQAQKERPCGPPALAGLAVTGSGATALFGTLADASRIEEVPAATLGAAILAPDARAIACIGAQSSAFIALPHGAGAPTFAVNDSCAAGTGSFFEDQMTRLGLKIEDYSELALRSTSVPRLSGRCTVFAKTDIIHRQQEGVPVEDILQGLCHAMVKSYKSAIVRSIAWEPPLALAGGVALNAGVERAFQEVFALGDDQLICLPDLVYLQAVGAAVHARAKSGETTLAAVAAALEGSAPCEPLVRREPLPQMAYEPGAGFPVGDVLDPECVATALQGQGTPVEGEGPRSFDQPGPIPCALGVDVGSTSTNLVLVAEGGRLLDAQYLRTRGNPREAVLSGMASLQARLGRHVQVVAAGVTGSGRALIGEMIGADAVRDEITAQARAAAAADPQVTTVFEIGGQDSKFIHLKDGQVDDFQMNRVCAAGTGSFIEEQAARLGIALSGYGELALSAERPVDLGERCTVFVETAINTALSQGANLADVAAGLCQSIVRNYLFRVVGGKHVGHRIVLQGGVAYNAGIVAAFKQFYGDALTVSPYFAVSGAVGAALLALEAQEQNGEPSTFRGFLLERRPQAGPRRVSPDQVIENRAFFNRVEELYLDGYDSAPRVGRPTVGVPRCLTMHKLFPMVNGFFRELGYNVLLSDSTTEETVHLAQAAAQGEVCFPVKLIYGHMQQLLDAGVDYLFFPSMHSIRHEASRAPHNYACTYMQTAPALIADELGVAERGVVLLNPLLRMDWGQKALAEAMLSVGESLGHSAQESGRALMAGGFRLREFSRRAEELGANLLAGLGKDERALVIVTRQYGVYDPVLNMGIADALLERGCRVLTLSNLTAHKIDVSPDYPGVTWPFGQHIIAGAKVIRRDPRLYAVYLTNHGCGPDTMISHLFREEMGDKPYLQIEVDEHFSKVGVITRIEAFLNAIERHRAPDERGFALCPPRPNAATQPIRRGGALFLPEVGLYGRFAASWLARTRGVKPALMAPSPEVVALGKESADSKEYLTFAATVGMALEAARRAAGAPFQVLLPATEDSEACSIYDRVTQSILRRRGLGAGQVVAPRLEQLPWVVDDAFGLFTALLAADVCYAAALSGRDALAERILAAGCSMDAIVQAAREVGRSSVPDAGLPALAVVGEWPLVYADELTGGVLARLERKGHPLRRMPLSECLLFGWIDAVEADGERAAKGLEPGMEALPNFALSPDEKREGLQRYEQLLSFVSGLMGQASPFAESLSALRNLAEGAVGKYRGAQGRYRAAKTLRPPLGVAGVVAVASAYENTDIMLRLDEAACPLPLPVLHLEFDGTPDAAAEEKLGSFLYYL